MPVARAGRFMYFAFGSNLLKERLQLSNPSATFFSVGRLKVCTAASAFTRDVDSSPVVIRKISQEWSKLGLFVSEICCLVSKCCEYLKQDFSAPVLCPKKYP